MTDDEVRTMLMDGESVQYPITMEERARLHILPGQLQQKFLIALDEFMERKSWADFRTDEHEKTFIEWQRVRRQREAAGV